MLYPIRYYSFISRELFIKTYGLCNPSSFQHPDILVPSTDSQCIFVTHLGLWSWSLQPSALRLLFSYYDFLPRPTKVSVLFFFFLEKAHKVNMERIGTRKKEAVCLFLCSKYLPAGLINLSLMSLWLFLSSQQVSSRPSAKDCADISNCDFMGVFSLTDLKLCGVIWHSFSSPWRFPALIRTVRTCAWDRTAEWKNEGRKQRSQENNIPPFFLFLYLNPLNFQCFQRLHHILVLSCYLEF